MKYALYEKATGKIVSVVQSTDRPQEFDDALGYADFPEDADPRCCVVSDGVVTQKADADLEQEDITRAWLMLRRKRASMLSHSDWTQVPDAPVDREAWAAYRQALRDLPANTTDPRNPDWPVQPV